MRGRRTQDLAATELKVGDLVVTDLEQWRGYIQVASVLEMVDDDHVKIGWWDGSLSTKFKERCFENGERDVQVIHKDAICLFGFTFTNLGRLRAHVKDVIRDLLNKYSVSTVPGNLSDGGCYDFNSN